MIMMVNLFQKLTVTNRYYPSNYLELLKMLMPFLLLDTMKGNLDSCGLSLSNRHGTNTQNSMRCS